MGEKKKTLLTNASLNEAVSARSWQCCGRLKIKRSSRVVVTIPAPPWALRGLLGRILQEDGGNSFWFAGMSQSCI